MPEIRSWAAGALAAATLAVGIGAGTQIMRTSEPPVAPVVAVAPAAAVPSPIVAVPPTTTATTTTTASRPSSRATSTTRAPRASRTAVYRCASDEDPTFGDPARPNVMTNRDCPDIETSRSRAQQEALDDEGPVIFGQTNAQAYRQCVRSPNSPGPTECRRITDAGGRGE
jgi:hypothetical protein